MRSRSPAAIEQIGKGISNYSSDELRRVARAEIGRGARAAAAGKRRGGPPRLLRARVVFSSAMATATESVAEICAAAKRASRTLATLGSDVKNAALEAIADALIERTPEILEANARDLEAGREAGLSAALLDRLALDRGRIAAIADGARKIAALPDPVGEVIDGFRLPNGLDVRKVRVPLGVVAVVYEARPNVTIDAAALCLKSGNAIVLRGSSSAAHSNAVLAGIAAEAAVAAGLPRRSARADRRWRPRRAARARHADSTRRPDHPARRRGPEGRAQGRRHRAGDLRRVRQLPRLRRSQRRPRRPRRRSWSTPRSSGPASATRLRRCSCTPTSPARSCRTCCTRCTTPASTLHGDERVRASRRGPADSARDRAGLGHRVPGARDGGRRSSTASRTAIEHINRHGSGHSEAIVTADTGAARAFELEVDAACVYVNASTRFTDGGEFGMGAEIGNSTQKLHVRGPDRPARALHLQVSGGGRGPRPPLSCLAPVETTRFP